MKVSFVNPPRVAGYPVVREERFEHKDLGSVYPPLSLLYSAAVAEREGHAVSFLDANGFDLDLGEVGRFLRSGADACLVRLGFDTQEEDLKVLKAAKECGMVTMARLKTAADAPWVRDALMQAHPEVDVFFNDEPESLLAPVLKALESGTILDPVPGITFRRGDGLVTTGEARLTQPDDLPRPAYHLLPSLKPYHTGILAGPFTVVQTSRGCPFTCSFCSFGKLPFRKRDVGRVLEELAWLKRDHGIRHFLFFDDVLTLEPERIARLMEGMIREGLDLEWACCTRANAVTRPLLALMKKAGCREIAFGIESGSAQVLADTTKGVSREAMRQAAAWCHELGILVYGLAIIGLPGETEASVEDTIAFIREIQPFYTQFSFCVPFPSTDTWAWYESRGYLRTRDWSRYFPLAEEPVIRTEALDAADLVRLRKKMYLKTMLRPGQALRAFRWDDWRWNLGGAAKFAGRLARAATGRAVR